MKTKIQEALDLIDIKSFASVKDLKEALGISAATADRYLQRLENEKLIKRVQGGAISLHKDFDFCPSYYHSENDELFHERVCIAKKAVGLITGKDCVFIGGGRNTLHLANELKKQRRFTNVITNSLPVAFLLSGVCAVDIVGSSSTNNEGILIGAVSLKFPVNKAFVAPGGITADGFYNATDAIVQLEAAFIEKAQDAVVLASSEVYSAYKPHILCGYSAISRIITPDTAPAFINDKGPEVLYV